MKTTQEDGRVLCVEGLRGWIYADEAAYLAWNVDGDPSGILASCEADTEEDLSDWCERHGVMGR
jgi:hypothetical protein